MIMQRWQSFILWAGWLKFLTLSTRCSICRTPRSSRARTFESMEGSMPVGNNSTVAKLGSRLRELGLVLPARGSGSPRPDIGSVASLFISRWDAAVMGKVPAALNDQLGIAIGQRTYKAYCDLIASPRWRR